MKTDNLSEQMELKQWFSNSIAKLSKEFNEKFKRLQQAETEIVPKTVEMFVNLYDVEKTGTIQTGIIHCDAQSAIKKKEDEFKYKGTYKLVKIDE